MSNGAALTLGPLRLVARWSLRTADHAGRFSFLLADMLRGLAEWRIWVPRTLEQATAVGYGSLFIVLLVAGFAGAVTSLQTGYQFTGTLPLYYAGAVISESMILELGPVLTALILAGRIGARYAAERSEEHTSELQSQSNLVCRLLPEKKIQCQSHLHSADLGAARVQGATEFDDPGSRAFPTGDR